MKRSNTVWLVWLALSGMAIIGLLWLAPVAIREEHQTSEAVQAAAQQAKTGLATSVSPPRQAAADPALAVPGTQPAASSTAIPASAPAPATPGAAIDQPVSLEASPVAAYWREQYGITAEDIRQTLDRLRAEGVPEHILRDAGAVFVRLPRRDVHAVTIGTLELPATAISGEPVPYRLTGRLPDASHAFTHMKVTRTEDRIVLQPLGTRSGEPAPGIEVPVELDGELEPLPAGRYRIEYPGQSPTEERLLLVE